MNRKSPADIVHYQNITRKIQVPYRAVHASGNCQPGCHTENVVLKGNLSAYLCRESRFFLIQDRIFPLRDNRCVSFFGGHGMAQHIDAVRSVTGRDDITDNITGFNVLEKVQIFIINTSA